jgi:hypothetical protein
MASGFKKSKTPPCRKERDEGGATTSGRMASGFKKSTPLSQRTRQGWGNHFG